MGVIHMGRTEPLEWERALEDAADIDRCGPLVCDHAVY